MISADRDIIVKYSTYNDRFTVTKGMYYGYYDSKELYDNQIQYQTLLSEFDIAPKILKKDILENKMMYWISEDVGLPIEDKHAEAANNVLDTLYDMGIVVDWAKPHRTDFVIGFDNKIRMTDFKFTEKFDSVIPLKDRRYLTIL